MEFSVFFLFCIDSNQEFCFSEVGNQLFFQFTDILMLFLFHRAAKLLHEVNAGKLKRRIEKRSLGRFDLTHISLTCDPLNLHFNLIITICPDHTVYTNGVQSTVQSRKIFFFVFHAHEEDFILQELFSIFFNLFFCGKNPCLIIKCLLIAGNIRKLGGL